MNGIPVPKWVLATLGAVFVAVAAVATDGFTHSELISVGLAALAAASVWVVPNLTGGVAKYAKLFVMAGMAALDVLLVLLPGGIQGAEWYQFAGVVLAALGVPLAQAPQHPALPE